jgi:hypothetical protein
MLERPTNWNPTTAVNDYLDTDPLAFLPKTAKRHLLSPSEASCAAVKYYQQGEYHYIIGKCLRAIYWLWADEKPTDKPSPYELRKMDHGKAIELEEVRRYKEAGIWAGLHGGRQYTYRDRNTDESGELDVFVKDPATSLVVPQEIKSIYGYQAEKEIFGNTKVKGAPRIDNLPQCLLYLEHTGCPYMFLKYIERGNGYTIDYIIALAKLETGTHPVFWGPDDKEGTVIKEITLEGIIQRQVLLKHHAEKQILPRCDFEHIYTPEKILFLKTVGILGKTSEKSGDWQCSYCSYRKKCYALRKETGEYK